MYIIVFKVQTDALGLIHYKHIFKTFNYRSWSNIVILIAIKLFLYENPQIF